MVGEVTSSTALVQVRLTESNELVNGDVPGKAGVVAFELFSVDSSANRKSIGKLTVEAVADNDFIARTITAKRKSPKHQIHSCPVHKPTSKRCPARTVRTR